MKITQKDQNITELCSSPQEFLINLLAQNIKTKPLAMAQHEIIMAVYRRTSSMASTEIQLVWLSLFSHIQKILYQTRRAVTA